MTMIVKLPGAFFEDHMNRYLGDGAWADYDRETEQWSGRYVRTELTSEQVSELLMDAEFYAEGGGGFGPEYRGLMSSAAATVRQLAKQGVTA